MRSRAKVPLRMALPLAMAMPRRMAVYRAQHSLQHVGFVLLLVMSCVQTFGRSVQSSDRSIYHPPGRLIDSSVVKPIALIAVCQAVAFAVQIHKLAGLVIFCSTILRQDKL